MSKWRDLLRKIPLPNRVPILSLILGVLIVVSVVPMYFYSTKVTQINRDSLKLNEKLLQSTITRSVAEDIGLRQANLEAMLSNLASAIQISSGGDLRGEHVNAPELRALVEKFLSSSSDVAYATLLNADAKGISAGRISPDVFLQNDLVRAFAAARDGRGYSGPAIAVGAGKDKRIVVLSAMPLNAGGRFVGMIGAAVDLQFLVRRLEEASKNELQVYVVDHEGRLVASPMHSYATGQDMTRLEIVKNFAETAGKAQFVATSAFTLKTDNEKIEMLGTISTVPAVDWAVIAQKPQREAYRGVYEMQSTAVRGAIVAVLMSLLISVLAARRITTPLQILTESTRAIAKGDLSQRVRLQSRTEIGELAATFNQMTGELERYIADLKRAAEENKALFMGSIQMLAGAVDEKDPYTRGHSDRVTRYSVRLAKEMGFTEEQIEVVRVSAQLHDVGKIGIEDRILKKPGALTPEEYEVMKTHTTRGANILRPVQQLKEMIPGIELHHESLDGRGYPFGLKGDEVPLLARIISVADTFDAMTTNRPYQAARPPEYAVRIINSLAQTKFDPKVVAALTAVFERGELHVPARAAVVTEEAAAAAASANRVFVEATRS